jgi:putative FmdB family regulatory protein
MPTYEYRCKDCGHELEAQQAFTDDPLTECPSCGGMLKKRFGSVGISFKGSGFYKNDARGTSGSTSSGTKADAAPTGGESTPASGDTATKAAPSASPSSASTPSSSSSSSGGSSGTSAA